jgi:uncharacterized low-complexity protein
MKINTLTAIALTSTVAFGAIALADNPFAAKSLKNGYQVAQATTTTPTTDKAKDASCGADKKKDGKCGEGKCGADKSKDASCGADKKKDGKCGEGKCGADKDKKADGKCGSAV